MSFSSDPALQTNQLPLSIDFPEEQQDFLIRLTLAYKEIVDSMNTKIGGIYLLGEIAAYKLYFPTSLTLETYASLILRNVYRSTFDLIAMNGGAPIGPGVTVLSVPPNQLITSITTPVLLQGVATVAGPKYVAIPSMNIDVVFDNTVPTAQTVVITNNFGSNLIVATLVFEYIKQQ
jgi:hypothetical protein